MSEQVGVFFLSGKKKKKEERLQDEGRAFFCLVKFERK